MSSVPAAPEPAPDILVAVTLACPYVAAMSGGVLGEVATYLPGRRVRGIRLGTDDIDVHVIGVFGPSIAEIVDQVRLAVESVALGRTVSVHVEDLEAPPPMKGPRSA